MSKILLIDNFDVPYLQLTKSQSSSKSEPVDVLDREKILESVVKKSREGLNRVLAVLEGPYFVPDGYSQNKRFYPRKLWEKVVSEVRDDLKLRGRLGTLEHPKSEGEDHPKHVSHILKDLWIRGNVGYGKSYILNTPMGSLVHTLATATDEEGVPLIKLFVSSRAYGNFIGKDEHGNDIVDPDNYLFQTFDIVFDPGFVEAAPGFKPVVESLIQEILESQLDQRSFSLAATTPYKSDEIRKPVKEEAPMMESESSLTELVKEAASTLSRLNSSVELEPGIEAPVQRNHLELKKLQEDYQNLYEENQKLKNALSTLKNQYQQSILELYSYRYELPINEVKRLLEKFKTIELLKTFLEESKRYSDTPKSRTKTVQLGEDARIEVETSRVSESDGSHDWSYQTMEEILKRFGGNK